MLALGFGFLRFEWLIGGGRTFELGTGHMGEVRQVVLPNSGIFSGKVFYFVEVVLPLLGPVLVEGSGGLGTRVVGGWSWRLLQLAPLDDDIGLRPPGVPIEFARERAVLGVGGVGVGSRQSPLDLEDVVNIVGLEKCSGRWGLGGRTLVVVAGQAVAELLPVVVAVADVVHLLRLHRQVLFARPHL